MAPKDDYKTIPLTQGFVALVDVEDYEWLVALGGWCVDRNKKHLTYALRWLNGSTVRMHRLILDAPKGVFVDHINGDGLDNRRRNLRLCNYAENGWNVNRSVRGVSRYRGVSWSKVAKKWKAEIMIEGRRVYLGYFECEADAAVAYDEVALCYRGEFARLNFPELLNQRLR